MLPTVGLRFYPGGPQRIRFGQVTFVPTRTLRTRGQLASLIQKTSLAKKAPDRLRQFLSSDAYAICHVSATEVDPQGCAVRLADEALSFLYATVVKGRSKVWRKPVEMRALKPSFSEVLGISRNADRASLDATRNEPLVSLTIDGFMRGNRDVDFYRELDRLLCRNVAVEKQWRRSLIKSASMLGMARRTPESWKALLFVVIGLESLLPSGSGKKISEDLSRRAETCFGWLKSRSASVTASRVVELYKKRNAIAHRGELDVASYEDVLGADELLYNLLLNIFKHLRLWNSQEKFLSFLEKVEARRLLGFKRLGYPKGVRYIHS